MLNFKKSLPDDSVVPLRYQKRAVADALLEDAKPFLDLRRDTCIQTVKRSAVHYPVAGSVFLVLDPRLENLAAEPASQKHLYCLVICLVRVKHERREHRARRKRVLVLNGAKRVNPPFLRGC